MPRLAGKTAIVTGGAKGIGRHYSQALAAEGARVMIADIADGRGLAEEIAGRHGANSVASVTFDIGDENAVKGLVAETIKRFGQIDVLVNNAALYSVLKPRAFNEWDPELWDRVMAINVRGTYLMVRHVAPHMMERRSGKIINIGSMMSVFASSYAAPYAASKAGIVQLAKSMAVAWAKDNIQVNAILPGWIDTELTQGARKQVQGLHEKVLARTPAQRWGSPGDFAGIAVFLASPASDFVTGVAIAVDGGYSAQV